MTLTEFLLARIAEDEELLEREGRVYGGDGEVWTTTAHARVLADYAAKRRVVELHHVGDPTEWEPEQWACRLCQWDEDCDSPKHDHQHGAGRFPCDTLRALATVYADHPDYREEWRP